jgi:hypothetical protein
MKTPNLYFIGGFYLSYGSLESLVHNKIATPEEHSLFLELKQIL